MASTGPNLRVRISADLADIKSGLGLLRGELAKVKAQAATALPANNAFLNGIKRARAELVSFIGVYASLRGLGILSGIADEAVLIRGRIKEAKGDYLAILDLAQRTRSGLNATVDLYARLERNTRERELGQQRLLTLTEAINQAVKLSYQPVAATDAALVQLSQGLAAGALRGQELNAVMEQTPRVAQAIADGLKVPLGALRQLAKEGKLTTDVVIGALEDQADVLAKEYARVPVTIKDAFVQIRNSLVDYVGEQDAATGASRRFAATLQQIAKDLPKYLDPVLQAIMLLVENLDILAVFMVTRMAAAAIPALITAFTALRAALVASSTAAVTLRGTLMLLGGPVGLAVAALAAGIYYLYKRTTEASRAAKEHSKALAETREMAKTSATAALQDARAKRAQAIATLQAALASLQEKKALLEVERERTRQSSGRSRYLQGGVEAAAGTAMLDAQERVDRIASQVDDLNKLVDEMNKRTLVEAALQANDAALAVGDIATASENAGKGIVDTAALARDAIARQLKLLDQLLEDGKVSLADFYARKRELQLADIDAQIRAAQAEAAAAKTSDQQSKALTEIVKLQRERAEIGPAVAREQAKAEEELAKELEGVYLRLLEAQGESGRARRAELESEFQQMIVKLEANGRTAGVEIVRNLINIEAAKAQLDEFETEMQRVMGGLTAIESSAAAQQQAGLLGVLEAERQVDAERDRSLDKLLELRERALAFMATLSTDSPEAAKVREFLAQLNGNIATVAVSMDKFRQQVADAAVNSVSNLFMDLVEGSKSAGEALRDFVRGFALAMAQIAARALATYLVLQLLDAIYPGLGRATAATMSAGVHHGGGIAGAATRMRHNLSPLLFGAAPRYHGGGIAGLGPDEVPAILQRGEEVLTRQDPRHRDNGGGRENLVVKQPIVAIGDRAVADAMAGAAGYDVVVTHVRNAWDDLVRGND